MSRNRSTRPRRGRPAKALLSRQRVLRAALRLLDREGPEAVSIRRVARTLGVTPMAIYNHFASKDDLLRAMAEELVAQLDFTCNDPDWRVRIANCFRRLRGACLEHPGVVRLMESIDSAPPAIFGPLEITLVALAEVGVGGVDAMRAYFLLMNFTMGQVSYEIRGPFVALDPTEARRAGLLTTADFPHAMVAAQLDAWDFDAAFESGIATILAGLDPAARSERARL